MEYQDYLIHRKQHRKTRAVVLAAVQRLEGIVTEGLQRLDTALTGISGDVTRLKEAAANLQLALDEALADQSAAVQAAVQAAIADKQAEFDAALAPLVDKAEAIDAAGGNPPEEPQPEPEPEPQPDPEPNPGEPSVPEEPVEPQPEQ